MKAWRYMEINSIYSKSIWRPRLLWVELMVNNFSQWDWAPGVLNSLLQCWFGGRIIRCRDHTYPWDLPCNPYPPAADTNISHCAGRDTINIRRMTQFLSSQSNRTLQTCLIMWFDSCTPWAVCAEGTTPVLLRHPAVNPDKIVRLSQWHHLNPALFNLSWIYIVTQSVASGFWDAESTNGERSKDPTPEWSFLAQPGKASNLQGCLGGGSREKARGYIKHLHTYMDTDWSHTFQIHTKLPAPKFQGFAHPWPWKSIDGNKTTQLFSDTPQALFWQLDTLTSPVLALIQNWALWLVQFWLWELGALTCPVLTLFWELDTQLVRLEGRIVPSLPVITKTAFPRPAVVTGIPSGSLSQGQVTRRVYTKTLAALAMSSSEMTHFPEFFWVWGA